MGDGNMTGAERSDVELACACANVYCEAGKLIPDEVIELVRRTHGEDGDYTAQSMTLRNQGMLDRGFSE